MGDISTYSQLSIYRDDVIIPMQVDIDIFFWIQIVIASKNTCIDIIRYRYKSSAIGSTFNAMPKEKQKQKVFRMSNERPDGFRFTYLLKPLFIFR